MSALIPVRILAGVGVLEWVVTADVSFHSRCEQPLWNGIAT